MKKNIRKFPSCNFLQTHNDFVIKRLVWAIRKKNVPLQAKYSCMKTVRIAKVLEIISYIGLLVIVVCYFFADFGRADYLAFSLLGICILRMIAANLKASFYEKEYRQFKDDNEFLQRRVDELSKDKDESTK